MAQLRFEGVRLTYAQGSRRRGADGAVLALDGLDFEVASGESIALIGPSGCGKSSTLRMADGLMEPSSGRVLVDGIPLDAPRRQTALILQDFGLLPWKTVRANAELGLKVRGMDRLQRRRRAQEALELVDLDTFAQRYPSELSGGMRQRLAIARALALDIDSLLMDEPLSALDALLREQLQEVLLGLWREKGYTQMLVTHCVEEAVFLGQRILVMSPRPGRIVKIIDNPEMGAVDYRNTNTFFERCSAIREALHTSWDESESEVLHA